MLGLSDSTAAGIIAATASILTAMIGGVALVIASRIQKRVKESNRQVMENNGWAQTTNKTLEALLAQFHEMRGEVYQWRKDHEVDHPAKRRTK